MIARSLHDHPPKCAGAYLGRVGGVDVWPITLDCPMWNVLSADERDRAARFATDTLRMRWSRARSALRCILALYLGASPASLTFVTTLGKPALAPAHGRTDLNFNLSHCADIAVCVVTSGAAIGVDLERIRQFDGQDTLAPDIMTPDELRGYTQQPQAARAATFFAAWTMKEALAKAIGIGLDLPFNRIATNPDPAEDSHITWAGADWHARPLQLGAGIAAAVALGVPIATVRHVTLLGGRLD